MITDHYEVVIPLSQPNLISFSYMRESLFKRPEYPSIREDNYRKQDLNKELKNSL
jgi:hypothetical protein